MTTKERVLQAIQALPDDATLEDAVAELRRLAHGGDVAGTGGAEVQITRAVPASGAEGSAWDLLQRLTGVLSAPADWASEHDHYLYGSPKRSNAA